MGFQYLNNLINQLSVRHSDLILRRNQMLSQPRAINPQQRLDRALQYEQLVARIDELEKMIEILVDVVNLEYLQLQQRNKHINAYLSKSC